MTHHIVKLYMGGKYHPLHNIHVNISIMITNYNIMSKVFLSFKR